MATFEENWPESVKDQRRVSYFRDRKTNKKNLRRKRYKNQWGFENLMYGNFSRRMMRFFMRASQGLHSTRDVPRTMGEHHSLFSDFVPDGFFADLEKLRYSIVCSLPGLPPPQVENFISNLEGNIALFHTLEGCNSRSAAVTAIFLYLRKYLSTSMTTQIIASMHMFMGSVPQDGVESGIDREEELPDFIIGLRHIRDNWMEARNNEFFGNISKLLGILVTVGLCDAADCTFSLGKLKVFQPDLKSIHENSFDLLDAIFGTVCYFVENMYVCFKEKTLRPLLICKSKTTEIDEEYSTLCIWWSLVRNGNLEKVAKVSEKEFDHRLEKLSTTLKDMMKSLTGLEKKITYDKFYHLMTIKNNYVTLKISSGLRKSPFMLLFYGESSQGKTTLGEQIADALLHSAGLPIEQQYRTIINAIEQYMSSYKTSHVHVTLDDMCSDKAQFVQSPPTRIVVDMGNNQTFIANMPDLESKGKVFVEPELFHINTNKKDLDAHLYSNCPYSILRRLNFILTIVAKKEFQYLDEDGRPQGVDSSKVSAKYGDNPPIFDDIWEITIEKAVRPANITAGVDRYQVQKFRGIELEKVPFRIAVQFLIEEFNLHRKNQQDIIDRMENRKASGLVKCPHPDCRQMKGYCDFHDDMTEEDFAQCMECTTDKNLNQAGNEIGNVSDTTLQRLNGVYSFIQWTSWFPQIPFPLKLVLFIQRHGLPIHFKLLAGLIIFNFAALNVCFSLFIGTLIFLFMALLRSAIERDFTERVRQLRDNPFYSNLSTIMQNRSIRMVAATSVTMGLIYSGVVAFRAGPKYVNQGSLTPTTKEEVDERDAEESPWTGVVKRDLPLSKESRTITPLDLQQIVSKNLVYGSIETKDRIAMGNGLFLTSNIVLMPAHYFNDNPVLRVTFRKKHSEKAGGSFFSLLCRDTSYKIPQTDLMVCYSTTGGSFRNLLKFFPVSNLGDIQFSMLWRKKCGEMLEMTGITRAQYVSNEECEFDGGKYRNLSHNTFAGMCGATLLSHGVGSSIAGFHLGGISGTKVGVYGIATQDQLEEAIAYVTEKEGVLVTGSAENFPNQVCGIPLLNERDLHKKSAVNYMPNESQIEYFGSVGTSTSSYSDVKVTPISSIVTDVTGVPNTYCAPKMKPEWFGWQKSLADMSHPARPFPYVLMEKAVIDYKSAMMPIFRNDLWNSARPLTDHENLCGIPGVKFMDALKLDTSPGFPLTGTKRDYVIELEPTPDKPNNRVLRDDIMQEIQRCEDCYRRGERAFMIAKGCKKDEILAKEKCRIFFGNSITLTWLVRKYYLPLVRVLQMNPLVSEIAVGINSHGPEWDVMVKHVMKFGIDRILGGDYAHYDSTAPSQGLLASLRIMNDFAGVCQYTVEDLRIMCAMAGDLVYALIHFNGDLIGLTCGSHISGNPLTVILNCLIGCLNMRCYYYSVPREPNSFRLNVALTCYGDDNIGTVSKAIKDFTIKGASKFLAQYGQVYTMPDKESELLDFLPHEQFEFLKRKSVYCEDRGVELGALIDKSIFKMLHMFVRGKKEPITEEMACALNIDTALREWGNHGREVYESRRKLLTEVAERGGIQYLCTQLNVTYDDVVLEWKEKYGPSSTL